MGNGMSKQTEILREFRQYEIELYDYFFGIPEIKENINFYFIPKQYVDEFCRKFNFSSFSDDLDDLILYLGAEETPENKVVLENLKKNINDKIDNKIEMEKINNNQMLEKFESEKIFFIKLNKDGAFIPLTKNIWDKFIDYYKCDIILSKNGFVNEGELFIITEEEKKIDCFFTYYPTKDLIHHYIFIMDNFDEFEKVKNYFKKKGPSFSARYIISISQIDICRTNNWKKFKIQIPSTFDNIANLDITIYFVDSFKFNNYDGKNIDAFEIKRNNLFISYKNQNENIINSIMFLNK